MKKILIFMITAVLLITSAVIAVSPAGAYAESYDPEIGDQGTDPMISSAGNGNIGYYRAEVVKVVRITDEEDESLTADEVISVCSVKILSGKFRDRVYTISVNGNLNDVDLKLYEAGDRVMVSCELNYDGSDIRNIYIYDYYRVGTMLLFLAAALAIVAMIGFMAGIRFTASVAIFALSYHFFFVPLMLRGLSPILLIIPICLVIALLNIFSELGFTKQSLFAISGTLLAVLTASLIGLYAEKLGALTGLGDSELALLQYMPGHSDIDLSGLTFALSMLMSLGAAMSVSCTICTEMSEAKEMNQYISRLNLYRYGMHAGRNILSRSLISLFFAAMVSVVPGWIVYSGYSTPINQLMNLNYIASQFFRIGAAVIGVSLSVPFTSMLYAYSTRSRSLY